MIEIWTDGACKPNPGAGGWAAILQYQGHEKIISGHEEQTTNSRMELTAVIQVLRTIKRQDIPITMTVDSRYVLDGITQYIVYWLANDWINTRGNEVKNRDLWQHLYTRSQGLNITWRWVKGHDRDEMNNRVDEIAREALEREKRPKSSNDPDRSLPNGDNDSTDQEPRQTKNYIQQIKQRHPITATVAQHCGGLRNSGHGYLKGYCPFCQPGGRGSKYNFWVYPPKQICGCHKDSCKDAQPGGRGYMDVVNFHARLRGISNLDAIGELL